MKRIFSIVFAGWMSIVGVARPADTSEPLEIAYVERTMPEADALQLERFVNDQLAARNVSVRVRLTRVDSDELARCDRDGKWKHAGALLPAMHYVEATMVEDWEQRLQLLAKLRKQPTVTPGKPRDSYRSMVLIRRAHAELWPPRSDDGPRNSLIYQARSSKSTSTYIFPISHFHQQGWIDRKLIQPITLESHGENDLLKFAEVASPDAPHLIGVGSDDFEKATLEDSGLVKRLREVYVSEPIPYDALVVRRDQVSEDGDVTELQHAFLATGVYSTDTRRDVLNWIPPINSEIFDFVVAEDSHYDGVREAYVLADGGSRVRLGISRVAHPDLQQDQWYYRTLKRRLMAKGAEKGIYLSMRVYEADETHQMVDAMARGSLDVAELPTYYAVEAIERGFKMLCPAAFLDSSNGSNAPRITYTSVIVTNTDSTTIDTIDPAAQFLATRPDSISGFVKPMRELRVRGVEPDPPSNLVFVGDYLSVTYKLLGEKPGYGFMADFEFAKACKFYEKAKSLKVVRGFSMSVPTATLFVSRSFCPSWNGTTCEPARSLPQDAALALGLVQPVAPDRGVAAMTRLKDVLEERVPRPAASASEFNGYDMSKPDALHEAEAQLRELSNKRDYVGILIGVVVAVVALSVAITYLTRNERKRPSPPTARQSSGDDGQCAA